MDYSKFNPAKPRVPEAHSNPNYWRTAQPQFFMQMERRTSSGVKASSVRFSIIGISMCLFGAWVLQKFSERGRRTPGTISKEWQQLSDERDIQMNRNSISIHNVGQPISYTPQHITEEDV